MRVGFYKDELVAPVAAYDVDDSDVIEEVAKDFAEQEHQIDEASDMNFTVYVEDKSGKVYAVKFFTEYDPRFEVETVSAIDT